MKLYELPITLCNRLHLFLYNDDYYIWTLWLPRIQIETNKSRQEEKWR